jgi:hypothetical protein
MTTYAILNSNHMVENIVEVDENLSYLNMLNNDLKKNNLYTMKIQDELIHCKIGNFWNGSAFIPPKPYPSWVWDNTKHIWRAPIINPNLWENLTPELSKDYAWNEMQQKWEKNMFIDPVYFFHIPKTSGRFFYVNLFLILEHELLIAGRDYGSILKGYGHRSCGILDYSKVNGIIILRNPVERTISHYLHILNAALTNDIEIDKFNLFKYLEENPNSEIINYQTKYLSYSGGSEFINIDANILPQVITDCEFSLVKQRLSKLKYIFNMNQQGKQLIDFMLTNLCDYLNITLSSETKNTEFHHKSIKNPMSKYIYDNLSNKEKNIIENLMSYDMEIYDSTPYTTIT